jgi:hypothetical protein
MRASVKSSPERLRVVRVPLAAVDEEDELDAGSSSSAFADRVEELEDRPVGVVVGRAVDEEGTRDAPGRAGGVPEDASASAIGSMRRA